MSITISDIRKAILNGGDAATFTDVLHLALGKPPVAIVSSLEKPLTLPEPTAILKGMDSDLAWLLHSWLTGGGNSGQCPEKPNLTLVEAALFGRNISGYLEQVIDEVKPDVLALDTTPLSLCTGMRYAFSLPTGCGLPGLSEVRRESSNKPLGREIHYPGSMHETAIIKCWLKKIPLLPVGMPRAPESVSLTADEDKADEEMSGMRLRAAYSTFDEALGNAPDLKSAAEAGGKVILSLENTLSISMTKKLQREAHYSASRIMDIISFMGQRGRTGNILAIVDIKHSLPVRHALSLLSQGITEDTYAAPRNYDITKAVMAGKHSPELNEYTREFLPATTLIQKIFRKALAGASLALQKEALTAEQVDHFIAAMVQRTRHHPHLARGASVRGSLATKELLAGLGQLQPGRNRDSLEKIALVTLPPRITIKPGVRESPQSIVSTIAKEVLYDISFSRIIYEVTITDIPAWLSPEDIAAVLEKLTLKQDENAATKNEMTIVPDKQTDERLLKALESGNLLRKGQQGGYFLTRKSVERLMQGLNRKLQSGAMARERYEQEKARLEAMLPGDAELQPLSKKETAQIIMDFMDAVDKQVEKDWGKEINFLRMYSYYQMMEDMGESKPDARKKDYMALKTLIEDMEKRGILRTSAAGGARTMSGTALQILVAYTGTRDPRLKHLKESLDGRKAWLTERGQGVRRFGADSVFHDISFRHTLREIARQRTSLHEVRQSDFRIHLKHRRERNTDIVLCMDTSGSMAEKRKIIYARLAAGVIADATATEGDRIGIVAFDDFGETTLPLDSPNREVVNDYLVALSGMGATNIGDGIRCAADLLLDRPGHNRKQIILITDGEPNAITEKALAQLKEKSMGDPTMESALIETRKASARGITVSVVYLTDGKTAGDEFARKIARAGRGKVTVIHCHDT
ncbi:MAG: VWA domain-containing protein [Chloroflexota bacterium]